MKDIKDILENYTEEPSAGCWESIEQQLMGAPSSSQQSSGEGASSSEPFSSGMKDVLLQKSAAFWVKAAVIATTSVTVAVIATVAIVNAVNDEQTVIEAASQPIEQTVVLSNDTIISEETIQISDLEMTPVSKEKVVSATPASKEKSDASDKKQIATNSAHTPANPQVINQPQEIISSPQTSTATNNTAPESKKQEKAENNKPTTQQKEKLAEAPSRQEFITEYNEEPVSDETEPVKITIPNIITPNGDGYNDVFIISGIEQCEKAQLTILNLANKTVFQSNHYENNWGGDGLEDGVYYYHFFYTANGKSDRLSGTLIIKRK